MRKIIYLFAWVVLFFNTCLTAALLNGFSIENFFSCYSKKECSSVFELFVLTPITLLLLVTMPSIFIYRIVKKYTIGNIEKYLFIGTLFAIMTVAIQFVS